MIELLLGYPVWDYPEPLKTVKFLISDSRVDPSLVENEALRWAIGNRFTECVKLLLIDSRVNTVGLSDKEIIWLKSNASIVKVLEWRKRGFMMEMRIS